MLIETLKTLTAPTLTLDVNLEQICFVADPAEPVENVETCLVTMTCGVVLHLRISRKELKKKMANY